MADRAFPVVIAVDVARCGAFYASLGFAEHFRLPAEGEPGYIGLRRGTSELAVVAADWPREQYGAPVAATTGVRFEMFVYVDDADETVATLRAGGTPVLREPADMPWGERIAYVADPEGNPVALATERG